MKIISYKGLNGETRIIATKGQEMESPAASGKRVGVHRRRDGQESLSYRILKYWREHPGLEPREIGKALGLKDGNYVSQVLYRQRNLEKMSQKGEAKKDETMEEERTRVVEEVANYISELQEGQAVVGEGVRSSESKIASKVINVPSKREEQEKLCLDKTFLAEYEQLKNVLGKVMIHLLHNKMIDRDVIRRYIFNTIGIRDESDYELFVRLAYNENSWLYTLGDRGSSSRSYEGLKDGTNG